MSGEMWKFAAVLVFFAIVLVASYWFVLVRERVTRRLDKVGQKREGYAKDERLALHERRPAQSGP